MIRRFLVLSALLIGSFGVAMAEVDSSQSESMDVPMMSAKLLPDSVAIGDLVTLSIDVDQDIMQVVAFPNFEFDESESIELVGVPTLDTVAIEGRRLRIRRNYVLQPFDEGFYNLGRVAVLYIDRSVQDTLRTQDSLVLSVGTFLIDSTSHTIFEPKMQRDLPFKVGEVSGYAAWSVVGLIVLGLLIFALLWLLAYLGRPVMGLFKPAPPIAPHIAAFNALEELRTERLWQEGEYKGYYSRLSDILRTYISGRYGVAAMEMTSDEIIVAVRSLELPRQCEMELRDLLRDADLVKFAKAEFAASQNEQYFESAHRFVELTKVADEEAVEGESSEVKDVEEV